MSNYKTNAPSAAARRISHWLSQNRGWLSVILLACSATLFSSPTRVLAGKQLLQQAWTNVAQAVRLDRLPAVMRAKGQPNATKPMTVTTKNAVLGTSKLNIARQGHAAIRLSDGKILLVGGENANGLIKESEIYNPVTHQSLLAANLDTARTEHTASALPDGRILIVGGRGTAAALRSSEIYDPRGNTFTAGPNLNRPRAGHSANTLADGRILIAGGSADGSAEIYNPATNSFTVMTGALNAARSFHSAVTLKSGKVLLVGGKTANGKALNTAELFDPASQRFTPTGKAMKGARIRATLNLLRDGKVQVIGGGEETMEMYNAGGDYFTAYARLPKNAATMKTPSRAAFYHRKAAKNVAARAEVESFAAVATIESEDPTDRDGFTSTDSGDTNVTAGGVDSNGNTLDSVVEEVTAPATVSTDQTDYYPGDVATITGTGFKSNQTVSLMLERDPPTPATTTWTVQTDGAGNFTTTYDVVATDLGVSFILTASGQPDGPYAQTTFTDSPKVQIVAVGAQSTLSNPVTAGNSTTYTVEVTRGTGNDALPDVNLSISGLPTGASGSFSPNPLSFPASSPNIKLSTTLTITTSSTLTPAGTYTFTVTATKGTSSDTASGTGTLNVASACTPPSITTAPTGATRSAGDSVTFSVTATGTATLNYQWRKNGVNIVGAPNSSSYTIDPVKVGDAGSYDVVVSNACGSATSAPAATLTVNQVNLTVTGITANHKVYDGNATATLNTGSAALSGLKPGLTAVTLDSSTVTGTFADKNVGTGKTVTVSGLTIGGSDAANYTLTQPTTTANITARPLAISATASNKVYDGTTAASVSLADNRVSGDVFTTGYTSATFADKHVGTGKTVTVSGISITSADAGNYAPNTSTTTTANITQLPITVTAVATTKTYDSTTSSVGTPTISPALASGDSAGFGQSYDNKNAGSGKTLTPSGSVSDGNSGGNYSVTFVSNTAGVISQAPLTITAATNTKGYDGTTSAAATPTASGLKGTDMVTGASEAYDTPNVGTGKTLSVTGYTVNDGNGGNNYSVTTVPNTTGIITARPITVAADPKTKTYGEADPPLTYQVTNGSLVGGGSFSGSLTRVAGENFGLYAIQQGTLTAGSNYALTYLGADLNIMKRLVTVKADAQSKTYGDADPALTYQITSGTLAFTDAFSGGLTRVAGEAVGAYAINQGTLALNSNYQLTYLGANLTIGPRSVTVTANPQAKVYGNSDPALTYLITSGSLVNGDSFTGNLTRVAGEAVGGYAIQQGTLALNSNYTLSYVGANLTISARPVTVTADAQTKVYGDGDPALTYQITSGSLVNGDSFSGSLTRVTGENVSSYAIQQGTLALNSNYTLTYMGANLNITKRTLTLTAVTNAKTYDGTTSAAATPTIAGLQFSDTVTGLTETYDNKNFGTGKTLSVAAGYTVNDGNGGNNYNVNTVANTTGVINKATLTITAATNTKVYDAATDALATPTYAGLQTGDTVTGFAETYNNKHVGTGKTLSVSAYTVNDGNSGNNYTVNTVPNTTGVITKAPLTITAQTNSKVYDGTVSAAAVPAVFGLQGTDTVTNRSETYDTPNVGTGKTLSVATYTVNDGNSGGNYNVTLTANTTGVITAAPTTATVTVNPGSQQYSDKVTFVATLSPVSILSASPATNVTFYVGTQNLGTVNLVSGGGVLTGTLSDVALLEPTPFGTAPTGQMAPTSPGTRTVTAVFGGVNSNFSVGIPATGLTITPEDARATYTGALYASTSSATSTTATVTLSATIQDITATADAAGDASFGDIRNAKVTFINRDNNTVLASNVPVGLVTAGDTKTGTATTNVSLSVGSCPSSPCSASYTIGIIVTNYYTRDSSADNTVVTVAQPGTNFITGGGYLTLTASSGLKAGDVGSKNNFGFNVKYNKSGTNLQGNINTIVRRTEGGIVRVYQIKGNSMTSLSVNAATGKATFNGKASIQDISNPLAPISVDGNATLQVVMTDKGEPGSSDTIAITVWDKQGGLWFASKWSGTATVEQLLNGGNLSVK
ncbi:MAG TPA: YDG domain-containing protein [Blastocatellia bacterium]|nr:YDG domain-containing protein [Blastocatellia bacterium]